MMTFPTEWKVIKIMIQKTQAVGMIIPIYYGHIKNVPVTTNQLFFITLSPSSLLS
jgi:hypothetical protein